MGREGWAHLQLLESIVHVGDLVLLVHGGLITEEADNGAISEAEELDLLVVFAGEGAALGTQDGIQGEGAVTLHDVGQLKTGGQGGFGEGSATLRAVTGALGFLTYPVLGDAPAAEVVLTAEAHRVLVDAQADGAEQLILQAASHGLGLGERLGGVGRW